VKANTDFYRKEHSEDTQIKQTNSEPTNFFTTEESDCRILTLSTYEPIVDVNLTQQILTLEDVIDVPVNWNIPFPVEHYRRVLKHQLALKHWLFAISLALLSMKPGALTSIKELETVLINLNRDLQCAFSNLLSAIDALIVKSQKTTKKKRPITKNSIHFIRTKFTYTRISKK